MQTSPSTLTWTYIAQFKSNEEKLLLSHIIHSFDKRGI